MNTIAKIIDSNTIEVYDLSQFDIDAIMHSGQVFRYFKKDFGYVLVAGYNYAEIFFGGNKAIIKSNDSNYFYNYFDLDTDYNKIKQELLRFDGLKEAINAGGGIRILCGEFVETVISFIISANNNIKRFTKTLNLLAENYGDKLPNGLYSFPTLEQLSCVSEADFKAFGCGYRSPYLVKAAEQLKELDFERLSGLSNERLAKSLMGISGVGPKVAACVLLFAFHRLDTAPVDTWIGKALKTLTESDKLAVLSHSYAGVAQQYIFYYLQHLHGELYTK